MAAKLAGSKGGVNVAPCRLSLHHTLVLGAVHGHYVVTVPRSAVSRALIVLWTIWLTAVLSNPVALHTCPTHGTPASHRASASRNSAPHAEHAALASRHNGHETGGHGRSSSHDCTCLGLCCCDAPVAAPGGAPELPVVPLRTVGQASFLVASHIEAYRRHVQPYTNGPPEMGASLS